VIEKYFEIAYNAYVGYSNYLINEILHLHWGNYFYWLIGVSLIAWLLEVFLPWRKDQPLFRKDFWLDGFYILFNYFLFSLLLYNALSHVAVEAFNDFLRAVFGVTNLVAIEIGSWPYALQLLLLFVVADFIQWNVHRLLHRVDWLWNFHKVHHSVKQMGFAAHMRFHFMETIVYKSIQYLPLAMIGFSIEDFFIIHMLTLAIGHINHANVGIDYGPLKYLLNNPKMHIWHHAKALPEDRRYGVNFGISLSLWDYLFGTDYIPHEGKDIELGYPGDESMPESFGGQVIAPFQKQETEI
jgi:sterol desaturase/sphingolipid hydroxylase (fatty acid hydroxylase superfamily)